MLSKRQTINATVNETSDKLLTNKIAVGVCQISVCGALRNHGRATAACFHRCIAPTLVLTCRWRRGLVLRACHQDNTSFILAKKLDMYSCQCACNLRPGTQEKTISTAAAVNHQNIVWSIHMQRILFLKCMCVFLQMVLWYKFRTVVFHYHLLLLHWIITALWDCNNYHSIVWVERYFLKRMYAST